MLRKKRIRYNEFHDSNEYKLSFEIMFTDNNIKSYEFTVDRETSKIIYMKVFKKPVETKLIEINNLDGNIY